MDDLIEELGLRLINETILGSCLFVGFWRKPLAPAGPVNGLEFDTPEKELDFHVTVGGHGAVQMSWPGLTTGEAWNRLGVWLQQT